MIVVDVGCARYGGDYSVERLIDMFHPDVLYGFDPAWSADMYEPAPETTTAVHISNEVAWTHDGTVGFLIDGLNGQVGNAAHWPARPCIDLARFIDELPAGEIILKLDAEGAEYALLRHLVRKSVDLRLSRVLVEWHDRGEQALQHRRTLIERSLTCVVEEWPW